jgi:hypothetical protein
MTQIIVEDSIIAGCVVFSLEYFVSLYINIYMFMLLH